MNKKWNITCSLATEDMIAGRIPYDTTTFAVANDYFTFGKTSQEAIDYAVQWLIEQNNFKNEEIVEEIKAYGYNVGLLITNEETGERKKYWNFTAIEVGDEE